MSSLSAVLSTRIGRRRKLGEVACTECTEQGNDFELTPMVEMETRYPAPKICQGQPPIMYPECSRYHPNQFTFGRVVAERVNTAET